MSLPQPLDERIQTLRQAIRSVSSTDWRPFTHSAPGDVEALTGQVRSTPEIARACEELLARCEELAGEIVDRGLHAEPLDKAVEGARQSALSALDTLERALASAEPSAGAGAAGSTL